MDYADYVRQITFRLVQPEAPRPTGFRALDRLARKTGMNLEMWMTRLPEEQETMQRRLRRVARLRRRSTFAVGAIINRGVQQLPAGQAFLSLGISGGYPLLAGMAANRDKICIGVENAFRSPAARVAFLDWFGRWKSPRHEFHERALRDYLTDEHREPIGFCNCSGPRTYEDQFDALRLAEPHFAENALILINDANRSEIRRAVADFQEGCRIEYRALLDVRTPRRGHPTFGNGVLLLQGGPRKGAVAASSEEPRRAA